LCSSAMLVATVVPCMEIYTPTPTEKEQWRSIGEELWQTAGGDIDPSVIERLVALR